MTKTPDFQKTLKRMLSSPPKENKTLTQQKEADARKEPTKRNMDDEG